MRALDIRANFAMAKVIAAFDMDGAEYLVGESLFAAENLGYSDYAIRAHNDVPPLLSGEVLLVAAWKDGYKMAEEIALGVDD